MFFESSSAVHVLPLLLIDQVLHLHLTLNIFVICRGSYGR